MNDLRKQGEIYRKQVVELQKKVAEFNSPPPVEDLAGLEDKVKLFGNYMNRSYNARRSWSLELSWSQVFCCIAPYLETVPTDTYVRSVLTDAAFALCGWEQSHGDGPVLDDQMFRTIALQLKALNLVNTQYAETTTGGKALFWSITPTGQRLMIQRRTVRKTPEPAEGELKQRS
jgi:hypothetical protein